MIASGYRFGFGGRFPRDSHHFGGGRRQLDGPRLNRCIEIQALSKLKVLIESPPVPMQDLISTSELNNASQLLQIAESSSENSESMDEREALRRKRISMANTGKKPWNLGRKHSPETIAKIREKSIEAMKRPEVAENFKRSIEHRVQVHSPEVRARISESLKQSRAAKRAKLGLPSLEEQERQKEEMKVEREKEKQREKAEREEAKRLMAENLKAQKAAMRQMTDGPKKRTSNTLEHRKAISDAIKAKWKDPEYRELATRRMKEVNVEKAAAQGLPPPSERSPRKSGVKTSSASYSPDKKRVSKKNQMLQQIQTIVNQLLSSRKLLSGMDVKISEMQGQADAFLNDPIMTTRLENLLQEIQLRRRELLVSVEGLEAKIPEGITFDENGKVSASFIKADDRGSQESSRSAKGSKSPSEAPLSTPVVKKESKNVKGGNVKAVEGEPMRTRGEIKKRTAWSSPSR